MESQPDISPPDPSDPDIIDSIAGSMRIVANMLMSLKALHHTGRTPEELLDSLYVMYKLLPRLANAIQSVHAI